MHVQAPYRSSSVSCQGWRLNRWPSPHRSWGLPLHPGVSAWFSPERRTWNSQPRFAPQHPEDAGRASSCWSVWIKLLWAIFCTVSGAWWCKNTDDLLSFLQLLSALDSISLILAPPLRHLTVGLGHSTLQFSLGFLFLLKLLPQEVTVVASWLDSVGKGILCLSKEKCQNNVSWIKIIKRWN